MADGADLKRPLLERPTFARGGGKVSYAKAGILSRLTFVWMNPLLKTGREKLLQVEDVPLLGDQDDSAENAYEMLAASWNKQEAGSKSLLLAIFSSFRYLVALSAVLGLFQLSVMFVGPIYIQRFIDVAAQTDRVWSDGAVLVAVLLCAKMFEVVVGRMFQFHNDRLGLAVSCGLTSMIYRKGLRITNSARQSFGVGKIVNFMTTDTEECYRACFELHSLWLIPLQIIVALVILYQVVGLATFAGTATMILTMAFSFFISTLSSKNQKKVMECKDKRLKVTTEALNNMKVIKLSAWQDKFLQRVEDARKAERVWIKTIMYLQCLNIFSLWVSPLVVTVTTFGTCLLLNIELTPGRIFTAIATFRILQEPLRTFPNLVTIAAQALVSIKRLKGYLESPEIDSRAVQTLPAGEEFGIIVRDGSFKWGAGDENCSLSNIDFQAKAGSFVAVVGLVGSGKSSLLSSILGIMEKVSGDVLVSGRLAYVAQSAWIQNGTIRENILFGKPLDTVRYQEILRVCALEGDLSQLTHGDQTEIGERGINLSGGQKQRIQLARAVYQDADVYLLDDVFSAVDAHTGTQLFTECVMGALRGKTVLLVTHQVEFLRGADTILVMRNGEIVQAGVYQTLVQQGIDFGALVNAHSEALESAERRLEDLEIRVGDRVAAAAGEAEEEEKDRLQEALFSAEDDNPASQSGDANGAPGSLGATSITHESAAVASITSPSNPTRTSTGQEVNAVEKSNGHRSYGGAEKSVPAQAPVEPASRLIEDEERAKGQVSAAVYWAYLTKVFYGAHVFVLLLIQIAWQTLQITSDYWLAYSTSPEGEEEFEPRRFIGVYALLAVGIATFVLLRALVVSFAGLRGAQRFFNDMLRSIFRAPMSFFDTTPTGRILSRASTDQMHLDFWIPWGMGGLLAMLFQVLGVLVVMSQVTWQILLLIIPMLVLYILYQQYFIGTSRELYRLESVSQAPIVHHFSESIAGYATIRAFGDQDRFCRMNMELVDTKVRISFHSFSTNHWLGIRLESMGSVLLCTSALLLVSLPRNMSPVPPELVGLSLSYGMALNYGLYSVIISFSWIEQMMVSVERLLQYTDIPSEAPLVIEKARPSPKWPSENDGSIRFENVQLRYRPDTPLVLKGVSFTIAGGEKLGVVGRTGSGKSSLIQALFRLVEPAGGRILVDDLDISTIGLKDLRSKFSIIPQEPTMVEGTLRSNIDPLGEHGDPEIWEALEKCQLARVVREKEEKLDSPVAENGENWSMGQRQLFCLARALLKRSALLVLDEATASVDTQTDAVIQRTIAEEFEHCTIISIAHRISSVLGSDKVLVLDSGHVKEFGTPSSLLEDPASLFSALVHEYWNRSNRSHTSLAALS